MRVLDVHIRPQYQFGLDGVKLSHVSIQFETTDHTEMPPVNGLAQRVMLPAIGEVDAICTGLGPELAGIGSGVLSWTCSWVAVGTPRLAADQLDLQLGLACFLAGRPLFLEDSQADEDERWLTIAAEIIAMRKGGAS